jgi:hypothetical protein
MVLVTAAILASAMGGAGELIFSDGFETGDTSMWGGVVDPDSPYVRLSAAAVAVSESAAQVELLVELVNGGAEDVVVSWAAAGGTATAGSDFTPASDQLTLNAVQNLAAIAVPLLDDQTDEFDEHFTISITGAAGAVIASPKTALVTIFDDDDPDRFLSFVDPSHTAAEGGSPIELTVVLDSPSDSEVTVRIVTGGGSAMPGIDFVPVDQVLVFAPGEVSKNVEVSVVDESTYEGTESFPVLLMSPTGLAALGNPSVATVEISAPWYRFCCQSRAV